MDRRSKHSVAIMMLLEEADLAKETEKLHELRSATECTTALRKGGRATLIAAAVMGKIDVSRGLEPTNRAAKETSC